LRVVSSLRPAGWFCGLSSKEPLVDCVDLHYRLLLLHRLVAHGYASPWRFRCLGRVDRFTLLCLQAWRCGESNPGPVDVQLFFYKLRLYQPRYYRALREGCSTYLKPDCPPRTSALPGAEALRLNHAARAYADVLAFIVLTD